MNANRREKKKIFKMQTKNASAQVAQAFSQENKVAVSWYGQPYTYCMYCTSPLTVSASGPASVQFDVPTPPVFVACECFLDHMWFLLLMSPEIRCTTYFTFSRYIGTILLRGSSLFLGYALGFSTDNHSILYTA